MKFCGCLEMAELCGLVRLSKIIVDFVDFVAKNKNHS